MPARSRRSVATASRPSVSDPDPEQQAEVAEALPYGLEEVDAPEPTVSAPIDLEAYEPKLRGFKVVVDLDLELRAQEAFLTIKDRYAGDGEKLEATYQFLETVLVAWNFSERYVDNEHRLRSRPLPQPRDGGVRRLKSSQLQPLLQAVNSAYSPSPNS